MKQLFSFLTTCMIASFAMAQVNSGTVTINVTGNRNKQLNVDGRLYSINNTGSLSEQEVVINDLATGQHTLDLVRTNAYNSRTATTSTSFTLRPGYDLDIAINSNGAVTLAEKRNTNGGGNNGTAISNQAFNKMYTATKNKTSSSSRATYLENEFVNTDKKFTSKQAGQLIQLVNSESLRLALAKNAYTRVVDRENYSLVRNLLNSTSNRNNLDTYIASVPNNDENDDSEGDVYTPMSNQKFQVIYNEVLAETSNSDRNYYLNNFFTRDFNYYTSAQARQLIQTINTEQERFYLSKAAYRGITDRSQFDLVVQLLNSIANRAELNRYIALYNSNNNNTGVAMSNTEFNKLYQSVSNQYSSTGRYNAINTAFTTSGNYFTAAQAKQLIQLVNNENNRLLLSKTVYGVLTDRSNYSVLNDLLYTQSNRDALAAYVYTYDNNNNNGTGVAMTQTEFNKLYSNVSNAWNATSKYNLLSTAFQDNNNYFTASQARQLIFLINTETERLSLAKMSYDNIIDRNNYAVLSDLFNSSVTRNEWTRFANEYTNGGVLVRTPMTDAEYNNLYRSVQYLFGIGAKYSSLTDIFNKETNYFTVAQAKQLIELVSAENNRLELAKLAYGNLTDPANYTQFYEILASQSSRDELNTFVGSNAYLNK